MKGKIAGLLILLAVIAGIGVYTLVIQPKTQTTNVTGYLGGEKIGLFEDEEFIKLMKKNGINMDYQKAGSLDMANTSHEGKNYLFPSSQTALDLYTRNFGKPPQSEIIFNTPIVLYTWTPVAEALVKKGLVNENNGIMTVDMIKLVEAIENDTSWASLGLSQLYGNLSVQTTDPAKSNSGNMFAGLVANSLNGGVVVNQQTIGGISTRLVKVFEKLGYMETSSADLFSQFLKTGMGAKPMIAGYESQLLEFSVENPESFAKVKDNIKIIYPMPTVWSSHIYIALDDEGKKATQVLLSPEVQEIAWKKHGFRTGVSGASEDTAAFTVEGVNKNVSSIIPMPDSKTMEIIINALN